MPERPLSWTDLGDGFYVVFKEEETPPLHYVNHVAIPGSGVVVDEYKCTKLKDPVAIKFMDTSLGKSIVERLNKEVKILRLMKHYHSIRAIGSYTQGDRLGILTQPVAECDLRDYLFFKNSEKIKRMVRKHGARPAFLPRVMGCLAHGLQYVHERKGENLSQGTQVRHRDIKPANILLYGQRALFADFGISKIYTDTQTGTTGPSDSMTVMVTSESVAWNREQG